ncbi:MAG: hypothetical protein ABI649_05855 [Gaiellaceae bacterium]
MTLGGDRLRSRRCLGLRVAFVLGILLAVVNRGDRLLLAIALAGLGVIVVAFWRDCRAPRHTQ